MPITEASTEKRIINKQPIPPPTGRISTFPKRIAIAYPSDGAGKRERRSLGSTIGV